MSKEEDIIGGRESKGLMNYKFTESLAKLNWQRVVRLIQDNPNYNQFKYSILYIATCSGDSPFPDQLKELDILTSSKQTGAGHVLDLMALIGSDTEKWTMSSGRIGDRTIRLSSPDGADQNLTYALLNGDEELANFYLDGDPKKWKKNHFYEYGEGTVNCKELEEQSKRALTPLDKSVLCSEDKKTELSDIDAFIGETAAILIHQDELSAKATAGKAIINNTCKACHSGSGPKLNFFRNDQALIKKLRGEPMIVNTMIEKVDSGVMPPNGTLSDQEKSSVIEFLKTLK